MQSCEVVHGSLSLISSLKGFSSKFWSHINQTLLLEIHWTKSRDCLCSNYWGSYINIEENVLVSDAWHYFPMSCYKNNEGAQWNVGCICLLRILYPERWNGQQANRRREWNVRMQRALITLVLSRVGLGVQTRLISTSTSFIAQINWKENIYRIGNVRSFAFNFPSLESIFVTWIKGPFYSHKSHWT